MLHLLLTFCLLSNPAACVVREPLVHPAITPQACGAWARLELPAFVHAMPGSALKSWSCSYASHPTWKA